MATLSQLDAAIAALKGVETGFIAEVNTCLANLAAANVKLAAGVDVSPEVTAINLQIQTLNNALMAVHQADPGPTT